MTAALLSAPVSFISTSGRGSLSCNCFDRVAEACDKKLRGETGADSAEVAESGFDNAVWVMSADDHAPVSLKYRRRKNGEPESRQTNRDMAVMMRCCPFCGVPFSGTDVRNAPAPSVP